jgi:hypothetical protein
MVMKERGKPDNSNNLDKARNVQTGMRPDQYPESAMTKDQRADVERMKKESRYGAEHKDKVGSRET